MKQKGWLITALVSLVLLFFLKKSIILTLCLKFLVNNFASARSDFKIVAFLIFLFLVGIMLFLFANNKLEFLKKAVSWKYLIPLFMILLGIAFILGIASYIYFINSFDFPLFGRYEAIEGGKQSSTQFFHIHNSKAGLAVLLDYFSKDSHHLYDAGLFYSRYMPHSFWIISIIISPILFIFGILIVLQIYAKLEENQQKQQLSLYLFLLIISIYALIKNTIDGGLFDNETIFWLAIFIATISTYLNPIEYFKKTLLYLFFSYAVFSIPFLFFEDGPIHMLMQGIGQLSFFLLILFLYITIEKKQFHYAIISFLLFMVFVFTLSHFYPASYLNYTFDEFKEMPIIIEENSLVYMYYPNINKTTKCDNLLYEQEDFKICTFNTTEKTTILNLMDKYSLLQPNFKPIKIVNYTCTSEYSIMASHDFIVINGTIPDTIDLGFLNISFSSLNQSYGDYELYHYKVVANRCIPTFTEVFQRILNKNGLTAYVVID